ncbi:uncharacterized protein TNCV_3894421 [Trichonephila clavipes]|nr:uncharacterized protein TNCV_3894421 [Trichonephila clavipes]
MTVQLPPRSWQHVGLLLQVYTNVGFVNSSTSAVPWIACKGACIQDLSPANPRRLRLQWAHEHRTWADWHQVVFSDESRCQGTMMVAFVLDAMSMNTAFQSALSNDKVA